MPILQTEMAKRLVRWQLSHTAPAPLALEHPVQEDLAAAADEIERLENALLGLMGLIELVSGRDDMPLEIREVLVTNHRTREALRVTEGKWLTGKDTAAPGGLTADYRDGWIAAIEAVSRHLDDEAAESDGLKGAIRHIGTMVRKNCLPPRRCGVEATATPQGE